MQLFLYCCMGREGESEVSVQFSVLSNNCAVKVEDLTMLKGVARTHSVSWQPPILLRLGNGMDMHLLDLILLENM